MIAEAPARITATLPANVAELLTAEEAVAYLTEAVGRKIEYSRLTSMLAQGEPVFDAEGNKTGNTGHPAVIPMKRNGFKDQGHWRFYLRDVRYAAEHWPRPVDKGTKLFPARKRRSDAGTGVWTERRRAAARAVREREKGEREHGSDQSAST